MVVTAAVALEVVANVVPTLVVGVAVVEASVMGAVVVEASTGGRDACVVKGTGTT